MNDRDSHNITSVHNLLYTQRICDFFHASSEPYGGQLLGIWGWETLSLSAISVCTELTMLSLSHHCTRSILKLMRRWWVESHISLRFSFFFLRGERRDLCPWDGKHFRKRERFPSRLIAVMMPDGQYLELASYITQHGTVRYHITVRIRTATGYVGQAQPHLGRDYRWQAEQSIGYPPRHISPGARLCESTPTTSSPNSGPGSDITGVSTY